MNPRLETHLMTAAFLSKALPDGSGVVLYDLTAKGTPAVFEHGVSGAARDAARNFIKKAVLSPTVTENGMLLNRSEASAKDRLRKLSVLFIKDDDGKAIGALALIVELNGILAANTYMSSLLSFDTNDLEDIAPMEKPGESRAPGVDGIEAFILKEVAEPERLTPDEKTELIMDLYDTGVFSIKGSVMKTASILNMSEQSVYRYIAKIRRTRGE